MSVVFVRGESMYILCHIGGQAAKKEFRLVLIRGGGSGGREVKIPDFFLTLKLFQKYIMWYFEIKLRITGFLLRGASHELATFYLYFCP